MVLKCPKGGDTTCKCEIVRYGKRVRRCGPDVPLSKFYCKTHHRIFTVYPPGCIPYARKPLVALGLFGDRITNINVDKAWNNSHFQPMLDAAEEIIWPEEQALGIDSKERVAPGVIKTQRRSLKWIRLFFGQGDAVSNNLNMVANILKINITTLKSALNLIRDGPNLVTCGKAVKSILENLAPTAQTFSKFLVLGAHLGIWGFPFTD